MEEELRKINKEIEEIPKGKMDGMKNWEQLIILVLDGSESMTWKGRTGKTKGSEVETMVQSFINRLKESTVVENFLMSIITYDTEVKIQQEPVPVKEMKTMDNYDPTIGHGKRTAIGEALNTAYNVAKKFLDEKDKLGRDVFIFLMTDGQNNEGEDPIAVSNRIRQSEYAGQIKIVTTGYGMDKEIRDDILMQITNIPKGGYLRTYNPNELREFLERSLTTEGHEERVIY